MDKKKFNLENTLDWVLPFLLIELVVLFNIMLILIGLHELGVI